MTACGVAGGHQLGTMATICFQLRFVCGIIRLAVHIKIMIFVCFVDNNCAFIFIAINSNRYKTDTKRSIQYSMIYAYMLMTKLSHEL